MAGFFAYYGKIAATASDCSILTGINPSERAFLSHWESSKIPGLALVGPNWLALGQLLTR